MPVSVKREVAPRPELSIQVEKNGTIRVDGKVCPSDELDFRFERLAREDNSKRVVIRSDKAVLFKTLLTISHKLKTAGFYEVVLKMSSPIPPAMADELYIE